MARTKYCTPKQEIRDKYLILEAMEPVGWPDQDAAPAAAVSVFTAILRTELFRVEFFVVGEELFRDAPLVPRRAGLDPLVGVAAAAVAAGFLGYALNYACRRRNVVVGASFHLCRCNRNVFAISVERRNTTASAKWQTESVPSAKKSPQPDGLGIYCQATLGLHEDHELILPRRG